MKKCILLFFLLGLIPTFTLAQINYPRISPACTISQRIGLTDVTVQYSRPGVRDRTIVGNLVPYERIWRVGANESTKFKVSETFIINGEVLPSGEYALYAFPHEKEWEVVFHTNTSHWGDGRTAYNPAEDALRIHVKPQQTADFYESLTIEFSDFTHQSALVHILWENTRLSFKLEVDTHSHVMADIETQIAANPTANTYYQAARYLQEQDTEDEQALIWLDKAQELAGDTYYIHRVRSLIQAKKGMWELAIKSAKKSLAIADELGKDEFVRMNQKNIDRWQEELKENK